MPEFKIIITADPSKAKSAAAEVKAAVKDVETTAKRIDLKDLGTPFKESVPHIKRFQEEVANGGGALTGLATKANNAIGVVGNKLSEFGKGLIGGAIGGVFAGVVGGGISSVIQKLFEPPTPEEQRATLQAIQNNNNAILSTFITAKQAKQALIEMGEAETASLVAAQNQANFASTQGILDQYSEGRAKQRYDKRIALIDAAAKNYGLPGSDIGALSPEEADRARLDAAKEYAHTLYETAHAFDQTVPHVEALTAATHALNVEFDHQTGLESRFKTRGFDDALKTAKALEDAKPRFAAELSPFRPTFLGGQGGVSDEVPKITEQLTKMQVTGIEAFEGLKNAMIDWFITGEFNASRFFESIERKLLELALNEALFGGGLVNGKAEGGLAKLLGFAHGGDFVVGGHGGTDSQLVAFRATPGEHVAVSTPQQRMADVNVAAPVVHVRSVNVSDPRELLDVIDSPAGEQRVLNHISRNPAKYRRALGL